MKGADFEARQRQREWFHSLRVPPGMWCVLRVDGRGFSRLTGAHFDKPYDRGLRDHLVATARALVTDLDAVYGYTQSDEISVLLPPDFAGFDRGVEKLVSVSAGLASAVFSTTSGHVAHFDSRVWMAATVSEVLDYFSWRQADATRSALNNWCYWTLRQREGHSARQATSALAGTSVSDKNELLFRHGVNFTEVPAWQRRGVGLWWEAYDKVGHDPRGGVDVTVSRRRLRTEDDLPMKDDYRALLTGVLDRARS